MKALKRKLDELIITLPSPIPSPDVDAPSPSPESDIDLPEDNPSGKLKYKLCSIWIQCVWREHHTCCLLEHKVFMQNISYVVYGSSVCGGGTIHVAC